MAFRVVGYLLRKLRKPKAAVTPVTSDNDQFLDKNLSIAYVEVLNLPRARIEGIDVFQLTKIQSLFSLGLPDLNRTLSPIATADFFVSITELVTTLLVS
ncbi:hypothetical protein FQR65_LT11527 [Abscondita terminalis]|nr:hypothetical protein FQR65_LT11527 [Abscondita terminalis]